MNSKCTYTSYKYTAELTCRKSVKPSSLLKTNYSFPEHYFLQITYLEKLSDMSGSYKQP